MLAGRLVRNVNFCFGARVRALCGHKTVLPKWRADASSRGDHEPARHLPTSGNSPPEQPLRHGGGRRYMPETSVRQARGAVRLISRTAPIRGRTDAETAAGSAPRIINKRSQTFRRWAVWGVRPDFPQDTVAGKRFWAERRLRMVDELRTRSANWRCRHLYPAWVTTGAENQRRARCLGCGELGPPRTDLSKALRALRDSFGEPERLARRLREGDVLV